MYGRDNAGSRRELSTFATALADTACSDGAGIDATDHAAGVRRWRVLQAVLSITSVGGYGSLSLSRILSMSGVPRREFNAWFSSPEDAFVAAHDQCMDQLIRAVRSAIDADEIPERQLRQGVRAAVDYLAADPARADAVLLEVHVAGSRALRSQEATVGALVDEVHAVLSRHGMADPAARRVARFGVGALREAIRARMVRGELHTLTTDVGALADAAFPLRPIDRGHGGSTGGTTQALAA